MRGLLSAVCMEAGKGCLSWSFKQLTELLQAGSQVQKQEGDGSSAQAAGVSLWVWLSRLVLVQFEYIFHFLSLFVECKTSQQFSD